VICLVKLLKAMILLLGAIVLNIKLQGLALKRQIAYQVGILKLKSKLVLTP
jgi:hypothetical protein